MLISFNQVEGKSVVVELEYCRLKNVDEICIST